MKNTGNISKYKQNKDKIWKSRKICKISFSSLFHQDITVLNRQNYYISVIYLWEIRLLSESNENEISFMENSASEKFQFPNSNFFVYF